MGVKQTAAAAVILLLTGCTSGDIKLVKSLEAPGAPSYTIGQLLDQRKLCQSVDWSTFEDERGRTIVSYRCEMRGAAEFFEQAVERAIAAAERNFNQNIERHDYQADINRKEIASSLEGIEILREAAEILRSRSLDEAMRFFQLEANSAKFRPIVSMIEHAHVSLRYSGSPDALQAAMVEQLEGNIRNLEESLRSIEANDPEQELAKQRSAEELEQKIAAARSSIVATRVVEEFQWAVPDNGRPILIYGGHATLKADGDVVREFPYGGLSEARIAGVVNQKAETVAEFFR